MGLEGTSNTAICTKADTRIEYDLKSIGDSFPKNLIPFIHRKDSPITLWTRDSGEASRLDGGSSWLAFDPESTEMALAFLKQARQQRSFLPVCSDMA